MSEYSYSIVHRAGLKHNNADGLSRMRCTDCMQCKRNFKTDEDHHPPEEELRRVDNCLSQLATQQKEDDDIKPIYQALQRHAKITEGMSKLASKITKKTGGIG